MDVSEFIDFSKTPELSKEIIDIIQREIEERETEVYAINKEPDLREVEATYRRRSLYSSFVGLDDFSKAIKGHETILGSRLIGFRRGERMMLLLVGPEKRYISHFFKGTQD